MDTGPSTLMRSIASTFIHLVRRGERESHSEASGAVEQWKNDKELEQGLSKVLMGDFSDCLKKLLPHSREMSSK